MNEKLIEAVAERIGGVRTVIPTNLVLMSVRGTTKLAFAQWIEKESKAKDYDLPTLNKVQGSIDLIAHLFQFQQNMTLDMPSEALMCKLFATTFSRIALAWFNKLPKGRI